MRNYALKNENAVYYECGYSCDNEIFLRLGDEAFFITDARYGIEAAERAKDVQIVVCADLIGEARKLLRAFGVRKLTVDPSDLSVEFDFRENFSQKKRIIKTPREVGLLRTAAKLGAQGFDALSNAINSNLNMGANDFESVLNAALSVDSNLNRDLDEARLNFLAENILRKGGELALSFAPITAINANAAKAHALPSNLKMTNGDLLLVDAGVKFERYCWDRTRTARVGEGFKFEKPQKFAEAKKQEVYEIVLEAQERAIAAVRPGVLARDIDAAARDFIASRGFGEQFFHSTGHGVGLDIHELPRISRRDETVIKEGMVFSVEPGIYLEGEFGVRIEDVVVVTAEGCEIL